MRARITISEQTGPRSKIRRIRKKSSKVTSTRVTAPRHATSETIFAKSKNDLMASYESLFKSIKLANREDIQENALKAISIIENSKAVEKVEALLKDFQNLMIKKGTKLAKDIQKSVTATQKKTKK